MGYIEMETRVGHRWLTNTFSPLMVREGSFQGEKISLERAISLIKDRGYQSAVGHEVTAQILTALIEMPVRFNRVNLSLNPMDEVIAIVPNFRADVAREFTREEVGAAGYSCFHIQIGIATPDISAIRNRPIE